MSIFNTGFLREIRNFLRPKSDSETLLNGVDGGASNWFDCAEYNSVALIVESDDGGISRIEGKMGDSSEIRLPWSNALGITDITADTNNFYVDSAIIVDVRYCDEMRLRTVGTNITAYAIGLKTPPLYYHDSPAPYTVDVYTREDDPSTYEIEGFKRYSTLQLRVLASDWGGGFRVRGRTSGNADTRNYLIPYTYPTGRQELPYRLVEDGIWQFDIENYRMIEIMFSGAPQGVEIEATFLPTSFERVSPYDYGGRGWDRLEGGDSLIEGRWYAIKALTDVDLSSDIELMDEGSAGRNELTLGSAELSSSDQLGAGDTLYGPFSQLRIDSGVALAYRL